MSDTEAKTPTPEVGLQARVMPPEGYRLLTEGEYVRKGDIYLFGRAWKSVIKRGAKWNPHDYYPIARAA